MERTLSTDISYCVTHFFRTSKDYSRIISARHAKRVLELVKGCDIYIGGKGDADNRYIEPTVVINPDVNGKLMQEEIFGPVLPVVKVSSLDEAFSCIYLSFVVLICSVVNARDKPLAAYIFSKNQANIDRFFKEVPAGRNLELIFL